MQECEITSCGNDQNYVETCESYIQYTEAIAHNGEVMSKQMRKNIFGA